MIWERRHSRRLRILRHPRREPHPRSCPDIEVFASRGWGIQGEVERGLGEGGVRRTRNKTQREETKAKTSVPAEKGRAVGAGPSPQTRRKASGTSDGSWFGAVAAALVSRQVI